MSSKLFGIYVGSLKQTLQSCLRIPFPGKLGRLMSMMDVATTPPPETKEDDNKVANKGVTRYKKRFMKRQWEDGGRKDADGSDAKKPCDKPVERLKRKKMAMLLGYCGVDYYGMQRNPGVRTIEEDLLKALLEAKYIGEEDFNTQQNTQFQRSSRTDKGVSAARQVVSLKLPAEVNIEEINKRLPECIKVFGVKRVTNRFNSKSKCNARSYSYTLPTYVFDPNLVTEEERQRYRISQEKLDEVTKVLSVYKGTKSYHNFTEKKHYQDPSASRYMMGFSIEKVFVDSDMEFAVLVVKGQSFMLHQIRKMVGLAIAIVRGLTDHSTLDKAFGKEKVMIPTAPGLGLVLDMVHYDRYDTKFKDSHASLAWQEEEEEVQKFKHHYIYPVIVKGEVEGQSMAAWLEKLQTHSYEPSDDAVNDKDAQLLGDDDDDDDDDDLEREAKDDEKDIAEGLQFEAKEDEKAVSEGLEKDHHETRDNVSVDDKDSDMAGSIKDTSEKAVDLNGEHEKSSVNNVDTTSAINEDSGIPKVAEKNV